MIRRVICAILLIAACLALASCGQGRGSEAPADGGGTGAQAATTRTDPSIKPLGVYSFSFYDHKWSKSYDAELASIEYPLAGLCESDAAAYPALAQSLQSMSDELAAYAKEQYKVIRRGSAADIAADPEDFVKYELTIRLAVRRADPAALSLLFDTYTYAGGAEGRRIFSAKTFDAATGKELALADAVSDVSALPGIAEELLERNYPGVKFFAPLDLAPRFAGGEEALCWFLDAQGLTLVFNPYDIAPVEEGPFSVTIPYGAYPGLIRSEYCALPAARAVSVPTELPYWDDLDGDGVVDRLTVTGETDEYGAYYESQRVQFNDGAAADEVYAYTVEPTLLYASDGNCYLYVQNAMDNDYKQLTVYRFSGGKAEKVDTVSGGIAAGADAGDEGGRLLTDPEHFVMESRTELLSTAIGRRVCRTGKQGVPAPEDAFYTLASPVRLTLLRELPVKTLDGDGKTAGKTTLPAGTVVYYFRTDGKRFADLRLAGGGEVRAEISRADWGFAVGSVDVHEFFDGLIYSG